MAFSPETYALIMGKGGAANGFATLNGSGKIPESQLPSYVDDVVEGYFYDDKFYADAQHTEEITGESGKIYVDVPTEDTYRWSGSVFVEMGGKSLYFCTYGTTTFDQIDAALEAGKLPVCKYNGKLYICTGYSTVNLVSVVRFGCVEVNTLLGGTAAIGYFLSCSETNDTWSADTINLVDSTYLSNQSYATESYVDTAIGGAIGGSY